MLYKNCNAFQEFHFKIIFNLNIPLSITNQMQRCTILFITVNALHVSGGFTAHRQELKLFIRHLVYVELACCCH
jgi:hypothetical protein